MTSLQSLQCLALAGYIGETATDKTASTTDRTAEKLKAMAMLLGSRGRAEMYGRPQPEGRDWDYGIFADDKATRDKVLARIAELEQKGWRRTQHPNSSVTISAPDTMTDISLHPEVRKAQILKAWALIEGGMSKNEAWALVDREAGQKTAAFVGYMHKTAADPAQQLAARFYQLLATQPRLEGFRDRLYDDSKKIPTIGYGINMQDQGNLARLRALFGDASVKGWQAGQPMTQAQAGRFVMDRAAANDIPSLRRLVPDFDALPESARIALLSAHWNTPKLIGRNLRGFLATKNYPAAVGELAYGHSSDLQGHAWRRNFEAQMLGKDLKVTPTLTEEVDPVKRKALHGEYMRGLQQQ